MRLIDADALKSEMNKQYQNHYGSDNAISDCISTIDNTPTIEPVKRGEWFHNPDLGEAFRTCSNCKISMGMVEGEILERFQFCPHCGTDMRTQP